MLLNIIAFAPKIVHENDVSCRLLDASFVMGFLREIRKGTCADKTHSVHSACSDNYKFVYIHTVLLKRIWPDPA